MNQADYLGDSQFAVYKRGKHAAVHLAALGILAK